MDPLTFAQEAQWQHWCRCPSDGYTNVSEAWLLGAELNFDFVRFDSAVRRVALRHDALRMTFEEINGQVMQWSRTPCASPVRQQPFATEAELPAQLDAAQHIPFDLRAGEPFRVWVWPVVHGHVVLFSAPHIVVDAVALHTVREEIAAAYEWPKLDGPPVHLQLGSFARWQRQQFEAGRSRAELLWWRSYLGGAIRWTQLPTPPRPETWSYDGAAVERRIASLPSVIRVDGTVFTANMVLYLSWASVVGRAANVRLVTMANVAANRVQRNTDTLVGYVTNVVAVRTDVGDGRDAWSPRAHLALLEALDHQEIPFNLICDDLGHRTQPLLRLAFSALPAMSRHRWQDVMCATPCDLRVRVAKYDLLLQVEPRGRDLVLQCIYSVKLFDSKYIEHLLELLEAEVRQRTRA